MRFVTGLCVCLSVEIVRVVVAEVAARTAAAARAAASGRSASALLLWKSSTHVARIEQEQKNYNYEIHVKNKYQTKVCCYLKLLPKPRLCWSVCENISYLRMSLSLTERRANFMDSSK